MALGWGIGQLYRGFGRLDSGEVRWRSIAGGNPYPPEEEEDEEG